MGTFCAVFVMTLTIFLQSQNSLAYETGADPSVCTSMIPGHGVSPQSTESPYLISLGKTSISKSDSVDITLQSRSGQGIFIFKGFLIQVRKPGGLTGLGTFSEDELDDRAKNMNCFGERTAVTHNSAEEKSSITVKWTPPQEEEKDAEYQVYYTAVGSSGQVFWAAVRHPELIKVVAAEKDEDEDEDADSDS